MPVMVRCQRKILIAIASAKFPQSVSFGMWILRPLDPLRGTITGIDSADQASSMYLAELALDFARRALKRQGDFVVKVFQGAGSDAYLKDLRSSFAKVLVRKPPASRPRSREVYVVAKGLRA